MAITQAQQAYLDLLKSQGLGDTQAYRDMESIYAGNISPPPANAASWSDYYKNVTAQRDTDSDGFLSGQEIYNNSNDKGTLARFLVEGPSSASELQQSARTPAPSPSSAITPTPAPSSSRTPTPAPAPGVDPNATINSRRGVGNRSSSSPVGGSGVVDSGAAFQSGGFQVVYGPNGAIYTSPAAAIAAGVTNYTTTRPPIVRGVGFAPTPSGIIGGAMGSGS